MDWRDDVKKQIDELEAEKARFLEAANRQVAFFEGGIAALSRLIADPSAIQPHNNGHATDTEVKPCPVKVNQ